MANLAAGSMGSRKNCPVYNNASADAGSERHHDHILISFSAASPLFTKSSDVCIISNLHRHAAQ